MTRILFDTNVVLDVLLDRQPFVEASGAIWRSVEKGLTTGLLAAHAVTTIHYLVRKDVGNASAKRIVSSLLKVFQVARVDESVLQDALQLTFSDFEDAVTTAAAQHAGCEGIVTRDPKGFRGSPIPVMTPETLLPMLR
jgi:predicted nucleic acid-binding protein